MTRFELDVAQQGIRWCEETAMRLEISVNDFLREGNSEMAMKAAIDMEKVNQRHRDLIMKTLIYRLTNRRLSEVVVVLSSIQRGLN